MKKLLIIYASYGAGHKAISNYIYEYFINKGYQVKELDILDYSSKAITKFSGGANKFMLSHAPELWDIIYHSTDNNVISSINDKIQDGMLKNKELKKFILDFNPDTVIATHYMGSFYVSKLKEANLLDTKVITIVTDYIAHQFWFGKKNRSDIIVVNNMASMRELVKKGADKSQIRTFGMPISPNFIDVNYDKAKIMKKLNIEGNRPVILFYAGGSLGAKTSIPYLITLLESKIDADVIFVSGKDEKLKHKAESIVKKYGVNNVRVLGFITNGPEYMTISDFVITKPGGITLTECVCFKKPMVLIRGTGGQENGNCKYLVKKGFAIKAFSQSKFDKTIKELCSDTKTIDIMKERLNCNKKDNPMEKLYELVESMNK